MTKNSFTYSDRSAQTYSNPLIERGISTTQIYDVNLFDYELEMAN